MTTSMLAGAENTPAAATSTAAEPAPAATAATTQQPGEASAEPSAAPTETAPASSETAAQGAPEAYTDFTAPDGVTLDPEMSGEIGALAKELGLSQENAQKVVDIGAKLALKGASDQAAHVQSIHNDWREQSTNDKEFGGDKLAESLSIAKAAMEATATPQLQTLLDKSGLGNHPEVIRHFLKIAPAFAADKFVPGSKAPAGAGKSAAEVLYPNNA